MHYLILFPASLETAPFLLHTAPLIAPFSLYGCADQVLRLLQLPDKSFQVPVISKNFVFSFQVASQVSHSHNVIRSRLYLIQRSRTGEVATWIKLTALLGHTNRSAEKKSVRKHLTFKKCLLEKRSCDDDDDNNKDSVLLRGWRIYTLHTTLYILSQESANKQVDKHIHLPDGSISRSSK